MEGVGNTERLNIEDRERIQRVLGSFGLYDASLDEYDVEEHPEDDKWIIRGLE